MYTRVIPRDLFNEAKLLKCLGQLALYIHDGVFTGEDLEFLHEDDGYPGFAISQDPSDGALYCSNLYLRSRQYQIDLYCPYNNKESYPLRFYFNDNLEGSVFNDDGSPSDEFLNLMKIFSEKSVRKI